MRPRPLLHLLALALLAVPAIHAAAGPWQENPQSQVRIMTPTAIAARSGEFRLGVEFRLAPGWHAYWRNSGDAGFPPTFDLRQTPQLEAPRVLWPAPQRYTMPGELVAFGYADEVIYPLVATLRPSEGAESAAMLPIVVAVDYLVCEVECVPYRYDLELDQPLGDTAVADPDTAPRFASWLARAPEAIAAGRVGAEIERAGDDYELVVNVAGASAATATADLIPDSHELFELGRPRKSGAADGLTFTVPLTRKDKTAALPKAATFSFVLTGLEARALESTTTAEIPGRRRPPLAVTSTTTVAILLVLIAARRRRARAARERARSATPENDPRP